MSRILLLIFFCLSSVYVLEAQLGINANYGARSLSLGGISATLNGADAIFNNFSNIKTTDSLSVLVSSERRFELEDLTSIAFGIQVPLSKLGHFGLMISNYGLDEYKEQKFSFLYSRKISQKVSLSVNFDYNTIAIQQFGNKGFISFGIGASGDLGEGFSYGVYIFSPEKIDIAEATEVPGYLKLGIQKKFSSELSLFTEAVKVIDEDLNVIVGLEYQPLKLLTLRFGYNTNPGAFSFGLAYTGITNLAIEGGTQYNTILGLTPGITVKYRK